MRKRSIMSFTRFALVVLLGLAASSRAEANLLSNGSFETPLVNPGTFTLFSVGSVALTDWTVTGPAGRNVAIVSTTFSQNGVAFVAQDGAQWLDLTGLDSNSTEGVAQTLATIPGHTYQLSYFIGNTTGGGVFGTQSTVNVFVNDVLTFTDTNADVSPTTQDWNQYTHTFLAATGSTTLRFQNGDNAGDNDNGLDNIVLLDLGIVTTPTPEPASVMVLGIGVVGLVGHALRTRRARARRV